MSTPTSDFYNAASYLSNASSLTKISSTVKLELYGLFKYLNVSPTPNTTRPSIFDMTGRAKWDAWAAAGKTYVQVADAEVRYLEIARSLGWSEQVGGTESPNSKKEKADGEDGIWDDDSDSATSHGGGLGPSVSTMAAPEEEHDGSIHGLAVSNNTDEMALLLQRNPATDVNARDEFGYTPLHLASDRGHLAMVKLLLSKGAGSALKMVSLPLNWHELLAMTMLPYF